METDEEESSEVPSINDLYNGFRVFERKNQAPDIIFSESHTVLFELPLPNDIEILPIPRVDDDKWDKNHVKLPTNPRNSYTEIDEDSNKVSKMRWDLIKSSLTENEIKTSRQFESVIKQYNSKSAQSWDFAALHELFEDEFADEDSDYFFTDILPKVIDLALRLPELIKHPIPLLKIKTNHSISMSQEQCGCLLANAFFCTFPGRNSERKNTDYPEINFNRLFSTKGDSVMEKIKCVLNYFKRICSVNTPTGVLTFQRRFIEPKSFPKWQESEAKFSSIKIFVSSSGTIEDATAMLQVDFANRFLGGGVLGRGCVQEEIRFMINPEMIVGMLFCESMKPEEAILMTGCEMYNKHSGYASSFKWAGNKTDITECDEFRRKMTYVVAIDALFFHKPYMQFEGYPLERELKKAFTGFYHDLNDELPPIPVGTGNWGCGAFRGFKPLKALIQLIACCLNGRNLAYYTFGETQLKNQINTMFDWLCTNEVTVGELWGYLQEFRGEKLANKPEKLYLFIRQAHNRAKEIQDAIDAVEDCDFDDDEEASNEKRKIDEIEGESSEANEKASDELEEQPAKKVKVEEDENTVDTEENILKNSPGSLDEKCENLSVNSNNTMEKEACEKGQANNNKFENKSELDSEEPKVEILNEFEKTIEDLSDKTSEKTLQNDDKEPLAVDEKALKICQESSSLFDILENETVPKHSSETAESNISQIPSTTTNEPSSSALSPEVQKPLKRKITHFFKPLEKP